ncbi:hypothetical protein BD310DRAFT_602516 [Dichomitus squalens]|uniref:F-box domain-containing protein n=1 Tax=Dichomitus squalens TaxID=114155 RepID=A0A4Q9PQK4_9APHY|nr:hypothetical protein BD310DRAFT_602516 [Dichomitus squalens]
MSLPHLMASLTCTYSLPVLSLELIETVVDMLSLNKRALERFTLTCRALLPRSRYHLFNAIWLQPTFAEADSLCGFLDIHRELALQVHTVTVSFRRHEDREVAVHFVQVFLPRLLRKVPHIRCVKLCTNASRKRDAPVSFHTSTLAFVKTTLHLHELHIESIRFASHVEIVRMLAALPLLRSLECHHVDLCARNDMIVTAHLRASQLRRLSLNYDRSNSSSVATLLLQLTRSTLEELILRPPRQHEDLGTLDFPFLQKLVLYTESSLDRAEGILRNFKTPSLQHLRLQVESSIRFGDHLQDSQTAASSLEPLLLDGSKRVTVEIEGGRTNRMGRWAALFQRILPTLHAQSRLAVVSSRGE